MRKLIFSLVTSSFMLVSGFAVAKADVEVEWNNPEKYSDIRPTSESRVKFRERTFKQLEEYLNKLAEELPDGQVLKITVTNLDLAGQVWPASFIGMGHGAGDIRLVKSVDIPRMRFSYRLTDGDGTLIKEAEEVDLKDMSFQDRHNPFFEGEPLRYERNMLRRWFHDEFSDLLVKD